jgi:hypothetical protein
MRGRDVLLARGGRHARDALARLRGQRRGRPLGAANRRASGAGRKRRPSRPRFG